MYDPRRELARLLDFVIGSQTPGAHTHLLALSIDSDRHFLYVRQPTTIGAPFGVAHIMPKLRSLATDITLCHLFDPFLKSGRRLRARSICHTYIEYDTIEEPYTQNRQRGAMR